MFLLVKVKIISVLTHNRGWIGLRSVPITMTDQLTVWGNGGGK